MSCMQSKIANYYEYENNNSIHSVINSHSFEIDIKKTFSLPSKILNLVKG